MVDVRFRRELVARSLDRGLFEAVTRQLDRQNVIVKTGTLVDATVIASASIAKDEEARWVGHRRKAAVHGYKAHVACDGDGAIIWEIEITPANINDGKMLAAVLPENPGAVYADLAYASHANETLIRAAGGQSCLPERGIWGGEEALRKLEAWNREARNSPFAPRSHYTSVPATAKRRARRWKSRDSGLLSRCHGSAGFRTGR